MKILIADDEAIIRMGLKSMLAELGHTVFEATNGREALQIVQHQHPELALLDIQMPYTDGLHVARAIDRVRPIPVVILTAFGQKELVDKASEYPIHGYLIKPVQSAELNAALAVATVVSQKHAHCWPKKHAWNKLWQHASSSIAPRDV